MNKFFSNLKAKFYNHNIDLETRLGTMFIVIGILAALIGLFLCLLTQGNIWGFATIGAIFALTPIVLALSQRYKRNGMLLRFMAVFLIIAMPIIFFTAGGSNSGVGIWFVYELFFITLALKGWQLVLTLVIATMADLGCFTICYLHPEWMISLYEPGSLASYISICGSFVTVSATIIITIILMKKAYNNENTELKHSQKEILDANNYQKAFLTNVSHEVRSPINVIMGMNEMILREKDIHEIKRYAADIQNATQALMGLVNDMLDFSRLESGNMEIVEEKYDVNHMLQTCYHMTHLQAKEHNLSLYVKNNPKIPMFLIGDEQRVRQSISNILIAAVKFSVGGYVSLNLDYETIESGTVRLIVKVSSSESGLSQEDKNKIFEIFRSVNTGHDNASYTTGLGLTISKSLVELMHGDVSISGEGGEICITLRIPQRVEHEAVMGIFHKENWDSNNKEEAFYAPNARVLVVDDIALNLKVLCGLLKKTQVKVDSALSGKEALAKCDETEYDLIFMDHMMPEMDGIEAFTRIKKDSKKNQKTPVVMLTANAIVGVKNDYIEEGFADYLSKPVKPDLLERILRKYIY